MQSTQTANEVVPPDPVGRCAGVETKPMARWAIQPTTSSRPMRRRRNEANGKMGKSSNDFKSADTPASKRSQWQDGQISERLQNRRSAFAKRTERQHGSSAEPNRRAKVNRSGILRTQFGRATIVTLGERRHGRDWHRGHGPPESAGAPLRREFRPSVTVGIG